MTPPEVTEGTMQQLKKILHSKNAVNKEPYMFEDMSDLDNCIEGIYEDVYCPVFKISSVTGLGLENLTKFIYHLKSRLYKNPGIGGLEDPVEYFIQEKFTVTGLGLVVSGVIVSGTVNQGQTLLLGPDAGGMFKPVVIKDIHVNRLAASTVSRPYSATFQIKPANHLNKMDKDDFRKGMCLLDARLNPKASWRMDIEVQILHHATTISPGYQAVLHCGIIRQCVNINQMNKDILRNGQKGLVMCSFLYHAEYIKPGLQIMLREGRTKVIGKVLTVYENKLTKEEEQAIEKEMSLNK